jgi:hypothetical protein
MHRCDLDNGSLNIFCTAELNKEQTLLGGTDSSLNTAVVIVVFYFLDLISVIGLIGQYISVISVLIAVLHIVMWCGGHPTTDNIN